MATGNFAGKRGKGNASGRELHSNRGDTIRVAFFLRVGNEPRCRGDKNAAAITNGFATADCTAAAADTDYHSKYR